jgi:hypothetical protein
VSVLRALEALIRLQGSALQQRTVSKRTSHSVFNLLVGSERVLWASSCQAAWDSPAMSALLLGRKTAGVAWLGYLLCDQGCVGCCCVQPSDMD